MPKVVNEPVDPCFLLDDEEATVLAPFRMFEVLAYNTKGELFRELVSAHAYDVSNTCGHLIMIDVDLQGRTWHRRTWHYELWRGIREVAPLIPSKGVN